MIGWEFFKRSATVLGLCSAVGSGSVFLYQQSQRISTLEAQILTISTTRAGLGEPGAFGNPVAIVCAEMARSMVESARKTGGLIDFLEPNSVAIDELGCKGFATSN